jgi:Protein of unknown function (DUF1501)
LWATFRSSGSNVATGSKVCWVHRLEVRAAPERSIGCVRRHSICCDTGPPTYSTSAKRPIRVAIVTAVQPWGKACYWRGNWQDETKTDGVNTCWDTHQQNFSKLKNLLCPIMDRAFSAFIADLADRGLLETTLVVALGEFGRTPKMGQFTQSANTQNTGRDHWPHAFTALLAGGGVRGGQIYGATTSSGGYVADKPVTPADLTATVLHHLGVDPTQVYEDEFQHLRHRLSDGIVVADLGGAA